MSPSPDPQVSNLSYLYQQQRSPAKPPARDSAQPRGRNTSRYERGRRDGHGERVTRIYPRELTKSPPSAKRFTSASPTNVPSYNATTAPMPSALGPTRTTAAQYTSEWTKSLPFFANQPSPGTGGIAINASSPPLNASPGAQDALHGQPGLANSPPAAGMRPLSHPNRYTSFGGRLQASPLEPGRDRRASMYSQPGRPPFATNPPLPHQPQGHYYNLPNIHLGLDSPAIEAITPGEGGYYCGFDTLSMAGDAPSKAAENVLLAGYEGGIDVFRVERRRMDVVGRLEGLRGSVLGAKILPWTARRDPMSESRPLIALVIHGPVVEEAKGAHSGSNSSSVIDDSASDSPSRPASSRGNSSASKVTNYQTTVEVYSLKEQRQIAVLYRSPLIPITSPLLSPLFEPPAPAGDFVIDAKGKFVVVASGTSGEVFIFAPYLRGHQDFPEKFHCIGKVWTAVQFRERGAQSSASSAAGSHEDAAPEKYGVPVFSLSDRWLAVSPPDSTTLSSVNGVALTSPYYERPPGLSHHAVPPQPSPNCAVDAPEVDSFINRMTREGTQVAIQGARWAAEKGMQALRNYMNKAPQTNSNVNGVPYAMDPMQQQYFPPTHGHNQPQPRQEATVISIYDLQRMLDAEDTKSKNALHTLATIPASLGCSFLSFSPNGLMLMTISAKGDIQDVWDLKRINSRRARKTAREQAVGPHVRQVARYARMTVSNTVLVVWSAPKPDRLAVLTDKGTVHMFIIPGSAFQFPPPRRAHKPMDEPTSKVENIPSTGLSGPINSAMQALNGSAKPFLNAVRSRRASNGSRFPSLSALGMTAAGAKSGKAVAAGVGKSINSIRHAGDNKLTLPPSPSGAQPNSVKWLTGKGRGSIALVAGGTLQIYRVHMRPATGRGKSATISKKKVVEFGLASIQHTRFPPAVAVQLGQQPDAAHVLPDVHGEWLPRALPARRGKPARLGMDKKYTSPSPLSSAPAPLTFSEIETNPPYQPFYTDRRVARFNYAKHAVSVLSSSHSNVDLQAPAFELCSDLHHLLYIDDEGDEEPWLFGEHVDAVRVSPPAIAAMVYDDGEAEGGVGVATTARIEGGEAGERQHVVVTTRRRRPKMGGSEEAEEGFFEDDCEVLDFAEERV